ncbi:MAG: BatA domain-containing protein [Saprospiraceae bacterium]|nr:BatA domain-containing protein [Saprospiraceae bacterium]MDZ4702765.1 BatA domain-containing protein [Saprospiraceae bacterium]
MQFLYPTFLFALAALAIPIIIHLFYFRRFKKVYFTNVRFLKEVKEEKSARSKLRNLLVLAMRLLALAFLVFAFAQPFIPRDEEVKAGAKAVSIFVDNSFSMNALSQDVPLQEKAKERAREIVRAYAVEDQFQILTNDFEGRHQRLIGKEEALLLIDEIKPTPAVKEMSKVILRQQQTLQTATTENRAAYLISDFQKNVSDFKQYTDTTLSVNLVPLQAVQERNVSIDTAWFEAPVQLVGQTNRLLVKVHNWTNESVENIRLAIRYEGQNKPVGTLNIPARSSVTDTVSITVLRTGWHEAELSVTDYPVQFDDQYFFAFFVPENILALAINEAQPNRYLQAAFSGTGYFKMTNATSRSLDYSQFSKYQLIVLNNLNVVSSGLAFELANYVKNGGNLLVFPGRNSDLNSYKSFLQAFPANELLPFEAQERIVGTVNTDEFIFRDVFENKSTNLRLPTTKGNFKFSAFTNRNEEQLVTYRDGTPFLSKYRSNQGRLYVCAAPLDEAYSNLMQNGEVFIPMVYKMAISGGAEERIAYTIGRDEVLSANHFGVSAELVYKLKGTKGEFIPEQRTAGTKVQLGINGQVQDAGVFDLFLNQDTVLHRYAFNFDRKESDLAYYNTDELETLSTGKVNVIDINEAALLTASIEERSQGLVLWRLCLILVLIFLLIEGLLLRFWKT